MRTQRGDTELALPPDVMTDCVDGVETLGGSSQPALRMEDLNIQEKLERTLKNNTGRYIFTGILIIQVTKLGSSYTTLDPISINDDQMSMSLPALQQLKNE